MKANKKKKQKSTFCQNAWMTLVSYISYAIFLAFVFYAIKIGILISGVDTKSIVEFIFRTGPIGG